MAPSLERRVNHIARELAQVRTTVTALTERVDRESSDQRAMHKENQDRFGRMEESAIVQARTSQQILDIVSKSDIRIVAVGQGQDEIRRQQQRTPQMLTTAATDAATTAAKTGAMEAITEVTPSLWLTRMSAQVKWTSISTAVVGGIIWLITYLLHGFHIIGF